MTERVFIPYQRDRMALVYAYRLDPVQRRRSFIAVARTDAGRLVGIGSGLDADTRSACGLALDWLAKSGRDLSLDLTGDGWLGPLMEHLGAAPCPGQTPVETLALYLDLAKQFAVTRAMVQAHHACPADAEFDPQGTAGLMARLLHDHDLVVAADLLDRDLPRARAAGLSGRDGAHFFGVAATANARLGRGVAQIACLRDACKCRENAGLLRRLGSACFEAGDRSGAIDAYRRSQALAPLPDMAAARLKSLLEDDP